MHLYVHLHYIYHTQIHVHSHTHKLQYSLVRKGGGMNEPQPDTTKRTTSLKVVNIEESQLVKNRNLSRIIGHLRVKLVK